MSNKFRLLCLVSLFCFAGCTPAQTVNFVSIVKNVDAPIQEIEKSRIPQMSENKSEIGAESFGK